MNDYTLTGENPNDLPKRAARALTEKMTVLPEVGRAKGADDLYLVVSESGSEYLVDARERVCECPDYQHREPENGCKHIHRTDYATGEKSVPDWVQSAAIDPQIGMHTDATISRDPPATLSRSERTSDPPEVILQTDGGSSTARTTISTGSDDNGPRYTYHHEPAQVGGARYVRCTECGAECVPAKPERMLHREGCSEGER